MKKISEDHVYSFHPLTDGFLYSYLIEQMDDKFKVGYKMVSFSTGEITKVPKSTYMLTKFGADYKSFIHNIKNYLTCFSIPLETGQTIVVELDGSAYLFDVGGEQLWQGVMLYQNTAPGGIAVNGNSLWVSYPQHSVLVRYNLRTLRQELRIGGENSVFKSPTSLFSAGSKLFVCSEKGNCIWKLDCTTYQTELYFEFDLPIKDYKFINKYEIAILESGIYLL